MPPDARAIALACRRPEARAAKKRILDCYLRWQATLQRVERGEVHPPAAIRDENRHRAALREFTELVTKFAVELDY